MTCWVGSSSHRWGLTCDHVWHFATWPLVHVWMVVVDWWWTIVCVLVQEWVCICEDAWSCWAASCRRSNVEVFVVVSAVDRRRWICDISRQFTRYKDCSHSASSLCWCACSLTCVSLCSTVICIHSNTYACVVPRSLQSWSYDWAMRALLRLWIHYFSATFKRTMT